MDKLFFRKCRRCGGTIAYDKFYDSYDQFWGWKCLICGEIVDPVILANRQFSQGINVRRTRKE